MFTGLIEEVGYIERIARSDKNASVTIRCKDILEDAKIGDSIAVNGICQTIVRLGKNSFDTELSFETLSVTNFSQAKSSDRVNLERAMCIDKRFGGHIVNGHIDGIAKVLGIKQSNNFYNISIQLDKELKKYTVQKGSIAINGISLTIAKSLSDMIELAIIPHTFENTNLADLKNGDYVNIEVDIFAKYVENFLSTNNNKTLDEDFLKENGFIL